MRYVLLTLGIFFILPAHADSMIRVTCEPQDAGARIQVAPANSYDWEVKGKCPLDFRVKPGKWRILLTLEVDAYRERYGSQEIEIGDGVVQRVQVPALSEGMTEAGKKKYDQDKVDANPWYTEGINRTAPALAEFKARGITPGDGKSFKDCENCPEMVLLPATEMGGFIVGKTTVMTDSGGYNSVDNSSPYGPSHNVTVFAFALAQTEVTQTQWRAIMGSNPSENAGCDDCAVTNVSWNEAKDYVRKLSELTDKTYRLPTETEWEYACAAGRNVGNYGYGDYSSCDDDYESALAGDVVASNSASGWGLYDMTGNVSEMVEDCWHDNYDGAPQQGEAWLTDGTEYKKNQQGQVLTRPGAKADCSRRVLRTGGFIQIKKDRLEIQGFGGARTRKPIDKGLDYKSNDMGFRVARSLP